MKNSYLKFRVRSFTTCTAIVLAGMLVSCSNDDVKNNPVQPEGATTETLKVISGASQKGRVESFVETKASKSTKLTIVTTLAAPDEQRAKLNWSATAIDFNGAKAYVTWHSNMQAKNPASAWGGAVDVIEDNELKATAVSELLKFNHVLYDNGKLFLGATSATDAGVVGRLALENEGIANDGNIDIIGFPGVSVNAVAKYGDELIAVSGYKGTYGTFAPNAKAQPYYDGTKDKRENVVTDLRPAAEDFNTFGGKYVTTDENGAVYVLYDTENAKITKLGDGGYTRDLKVALVSAVKVAETYDPITKEWVASTEAHNYYGKHVFAVYKGIAYVGCGKNGLVVYDLNNDKRLCEDNKLIKAKTTGVCTDGKYVYLATEIGLQVYDWVGETFHRYAFEAAEYKNGVATTEESPEAGNEEPHSPNFVAVRQAEDGSRMIYVAYGQSGVRIYKLVEKVEE